MERKELYRFASAVFSAAREKSLSADWDFGRKCNYPVWTEFVSCSHCPGNYFYEHRNPTQYSFELPLNGEISITYRDRTQIIRPGEAYLLPSGEFNRLEVAKDKFCNKWSIGVCGNIVGQHFSELFSEHIYFKLGESGPPVAIFEELLKLLTNKDVHDAPRIAGLTMQFLLEMAGRAPKHLPVPLSDIIRIFEFNIGKPLELAQVAAELNITVSGMAALFRKHIGLTPKQYRQKLRLQRAEQLLRENSLPIKEIALRLGYQAPQHFTRDIRKFFGCSPRELRNGENQP